MFRKVSVKVIAGKMKSIPIAVYIFFAFSTVSWCYQRRTTTAIQFTTVMAVRLLYRPNAYTGITQLLIHSTLRHQYSVKQAGVSFISCRQIWTEEARTKRHTAKHDTYDGTVNAKDDIKSSREAGLPRRIRYASARKHVTDNRYSIKNKAGKQKQRKYFMSKTEVHIAMLNRKNKKNASTPKQIAKFVARILFLLNSIPMPDDVPNVVFFCIGIFPFGSLSKTDDGEAVKKWLKWLKWTRLFGKMIKLFGYGNTKQDDTSKDSSNTYKSESTEVYVHMVTNKQVTKDYVMIAMVPTSEFDNALFKMPTENYKDKFSDTADLTNWIAIPDVNIDQVTSGLLAVGELVSADNPMIFIVESNSLEKFLTIINDEVKKYK